MSQSIIVKNERFHWLDVVDPTIEELNVIAEKYGLHQNSVQDCMDSEHLPKYERIGSLSFTIFRSYDEVCPHDADTVQELTRKIAVFSSDSFIITIHRKEQPYLIQIKNKWKAETENNYNLIPLILYDLIYGTFLSYERPIDLALNQLEDLEMGVFEAQGAHPFEIQEGYYLKRKAWVFKRMLRASLDILPKMMNGLESGSPQGQNLKELADTLYFYSDELTESVNTLLNLHISLSSQRTNEASHRTNEVVRVLTIFSVFLLPLNVLTGIYGMNFEHMPELKWVYGYPFVICSMVLVVIIIYIWFHRKGWLKRRSN